MYTNKMLELNGDVTDVVQRQHHQHPSVTHQLPGRSSGQKWVLYNPDSSSSMKTQNKKCPLQPAVDDARSCHPRERRQMGFQKKASPAVNCSHIIISNARVTIAPC